MNIYRANFDYEFELYANHTVTDTSANFMEYLMFFDSDEENFFVKNQYSKEYLQKIEALTSKKIIIHGKWNKNWWGRIEDVELERNLNSKSFCIELCNQLGIYHPAKKIKKADLHELFSLGTRRLFVRKDGYFSGKAIKIYPDGFCAENLNAIQNWATDDLYWGPWLNRIDDFGIWESSDKVSTWVNQVTARGKYTGTFFCPRIEDYSLIRPGLTSILELAISLSLPFRKRIKEMGVNDFKLDGFSYQSNNGLGVVPVLEINYRKTMGEICSSLSRYWKGYRFYQLLFTRKDSPMPEIENKGLVRRELSPPETDAPFRLFYVATNSPSNLVI